MFLCTNALLSHFLQPIKKNDNLEFSPLNILVEESDIAKWNNEGLPNDSFYIESAALFSFSKKCPLIIDTELRGIFCILSKKVHNY